MNSEEQTTTFYHSGRMVHYDYVINTNNEQTRALSNQELFDSGMNASREVDNDIYDPYKDYYQGKGEGNTAIINGVQKYTGASMSAPDLRAGAALVLAGLAAKGTTTVNEIDHILRGYENIVEKLTGVGANISVKESE